MPFDRNGLEHRLHDLLGARQPLGSIAHPQDEDLVTNLKLALGEVCNHTQDQTRLPRTAGSDEMDTLRRLAVNKRLHQRDIGPIPVIQPEFARPDIHARASRVGRSVIEDAALVDLSQTHADRTMIGSYSLRGRPGRSVPRSGIDRTSPSLSSLDSTR